LTASSTSTASVLSLVADDMREVDAVIARRLDSGVPLVGQVSRYIISAGGKRLRPALLLLVCGALDYRGPQRFNLAAVVEFIHTATLLHDDVVDESTLRRGRATANESFGNPASVLVGDFLYSRAFQMMLDYDGNAGEMGKNLGDDLREGKATLPLIAAMQRGNTEQRDIIRNAVETGAVSELDRIVAIVKETGALQVTRDAAAAEAQRAVDAASRLPVNAYSQGLLQLAAQLLSRRA
jgi:geranylgeranyl pyrophosphate synthase